MYDVNNWKRPNTVKRYLHPPKCERLFTIWPEGKIIMGENQYPRDIKTLAINENIPCSGIWAVHTRHARAFDFSKAKLRVPEDGTPIHGVTSTFGGLEMDMEAFCDTARKATCYIKVTVTNRAPYRARERFGLVVRSGKESKLVYGAPDGYCSHYPEVAAFRYTPNTFVRCGNILRDGMIFVGFRSEVDLDYNETDGTLWAREWLEPGASYTIYLSFGIGEYAPTDFDYEAEKAKTVAFWQTQLKRLRLPERVQNDPEKLRLVQNFTVQILQCYAHYVGKDFLVPRQGALQRYVWLWDQYPVLEAISRMGDFAEFYRGAISTYFDRMQKESGRICTFGEVWAQDTACGLLSFAGVCINADDRSLWDTYLEKAFAAFEWIRQTRFECRGEEECVDGLFPPMRGSDWPQVFQNWNIDRWNVLAMQRFAEALEHFNDPRAAEVKAEHEAYRLTLLAALDKATASQAGKDTLHLPIMPIGDDTAMIKEEFYPYLSHGVALWSQTMHDEDLPRVLKCMEQEGLCSGHGLYGHMPYPDGNTHIWYTTAPELSFYHGFRRLGEHARAEQILHTLLSCTVTEECYVCERIADNDPWYVPWLPNASGMGRLLWMLLDSCNY